MCKTNYTSYMFVQAFQCIVSQVLMGNPQKMRGYVPTKKELMTIGNTFIFSDTKQIETEQQPPILIKVKLHGFDTDHQKLR